jgi:hypothetical protein
MLLFVYRDKFIASNAKNKNEVERGLLISSRRVGPNDICFEALGSGFVNGFGGVKVLRSSNWLEEWRAKDAFKPLGSNVARAHLQ